MPSKLWNFEAEKAAVCALSTERSYRKAIEQCRKVIEERKLFVTLEERAWFRAQSAFLHNQLNMFDHAGIHVEWYLRHPMTGLPHLRALSDCIVTLFYIGRLSQAKELLNEALATCDEYDSKPDMLEEISVLRSRFRLWNGIVGSAIGEPDYTSHFDGFVEKDDLWYEMVIGAALRADDLKYAINMAKNLPDHNIWRRIVEIRDAIQSGDASPKRLYQEAESMAGNWTGRRPPYPWKGKYQPLKALFFMWNIADLYFEGGQYDVALKWANAYDNLSCQYGVKDPVLDKKIQEIVRKTKSAMSLPTSKGGSEHFS